jgi:hypothetical protein
MGVTGARDARENSSTASGSTDSAGRHSCGALGLRQRRGVQVLQSPTDGRARQPRAFGARSLAHRRQILIRPSARFPWPHPAARTSPAANTRRPRSSSCEPTDSHLCRIALRVDHADPHTAAAPSQGPGRRFICCAGCPNGSGASPPPWGTLTSLTISFCGLSIRACGPLARWKPDQFTSVNPQRLGEPSQYGNTCRDHCTFDRTKITST